MTEVRRGARGRRRLSHQDRRARSRGRCPSLPRSGHRGARRQRSVRAGLGTARRRFARAGAAPAEPYTAGGLTGDAPADLQAATAALGGEWRLGKLIDIQTRGDRASAPPLGDDDLRRLPVGPRRGRPRRPRRPRDDRQRQVDRKRFLLEWRGEADPKHVGAIETYWICTAEHGLNASTFTARVVASTGADCAASLSAAVGALSGPLHGGAPARVLPMLDAVAESGNADAWVKAALDRASGSWASAPRLPRRGSSRPTAAQRRQRSRLPALRGRRGARAGGAGRAARETSPTACSRPTSSSGRRSCWTWPISRPPSRPRCSPARGLPAGRRTSSSRSSWAGSSVRPPSTWARPAFTQRALASSQRRALDRDRLAVGASVCIDLGEARFAGHRHPLGRRVDADPRTGARCGRRRPR